MWDFFKTSPDAQKAQVLDLAARNQRKHTHVCRSAPIWADENARKWRQNPQSLINAFEILEMKRLASNRLPNNIDGLKRRSLGVLLLLLLRQVSLDEVQHGHLRDYCPPHFQECRTPSKGTIQVLIHNYWCSTFPGWEILLFWHRQNRISK